MTRTMGYRPVRTYVLVCCALLVVACGEEVPRDPEEAVVVQIDDRGLTRGELERYFEVNLVEYAEDETLAEEGRDQEDQDEVLSRLFDAFVEEHLLLAEAESRGMEADDLEVQIYLGTPDDGEEPPDDLEARAEEARRRIKIEKLQEAALAELPRVEEADVQRHQAQRGEPLAPPRRVELRALMLPSAEQANTVYDQIRRRRISFDEAVVKYETVEGQARPQRLAWNNLAKEVRAAIEKLDPGKVSRPLEFQGGFFLFQVVSWLDDTAWATDELNRMSREELEAARRKDAYDRLLAEARRTRKVQLHKRNLPFRYVPPA